MPASPAPGSSPLTLELRDVAKSFGAVAALRSGTLEVRPGSIHALVGENGAGKSTLVKIVAGVHRRDAGTFRLLGTDVDFGSTAESKGAGVAVIYQEPTLFPDLSVAENIFMGRHPLRGGAPDRPPAHVRRVRGAVRAARRAHRPAPPGARPVDRRPADHRDRQGDLARRRPARHGRAHRRAERRGGGAAVRRRPQPARRGSRAGLHLPPVRRGVRPVRHRHRDARRRLRQHRRDHRHLGRRDRQPDGRARGGRALPQDPGRGRRGRPRGRRPAERRRVPRRLLHRPGGRDRRARRARRRGTQRDRPRRLRHRPVRRRRGPPRRRRRPRPRPAVRDPGRHGVRAGGPTAAGPGHRELGGTQRRRRDPSAAVHRRA